MESRKAAVKLATCVSKVVGAIASVEKKGKWNATCSCEQCSGPVCGVVVEKSINPVEKVPTPWKKYPLGSDEGLLQCVDDWQTLAEDGSNAKVPCDLLKSGSATCQCAECCGGAIYDDNHTDDQEYLDKDADSVHSEEYLDMLSETHV
jgi:hypothetical protein